MCGFKDRQKRHWDDVAPGWSAWAEWTDRNFAPIAEWISDFLKLGDRVLDVGCGAGYPALQLGRFVGPSGEVEAIDISPEMIAVTARRAADAALPNLRATVMDAESLSFADASFDVVVNTYALMFCENPALAIRESLRVLVPHGRLVVVVWGDRALSPFFDVIGGVGARLLGLTPPDPSAPGGPWRFAARGPLESLLERGGFVDVRVESRTMTCELSSADDYVRVFSDVAWKSRLQALTREELARFRDAIAAAAEPYGDSTLLRLAAVSRCASARKPG